MSPRRGHFASLALAALVAVTVAVAISVGRAEQMGPGMMTGDNPTPPVKGLYKGKEIMFIHTEASDAAVAGLLTRMMGPKVIHVPRLARIPAALLADVYVFSNGVKGDGPMGFQPDVFDSVPGDARYTPLRALALVTWRSGIAARMLRSVEDIKAAAATGQLTLKRPGIVVNMPIITWPGGTR